MLFGTVKQGMEFIKAVNAFEVTPFIWGETVLMVNLEKILPVDFTLTDGIKKIICT
jgi:hypothetical protein